MINKINAEFKKAMLERLEDKKRVINSLKAEIKNKEIELRPQGKEISNDDIMGLIQKSIKQNNDANLLFEQGNRQDLIEQNNKANDILKEFLPEQLSAEEVDAILVEKIKELEIASMKDMGKLMGALKSEYSGKMDFGYVSKKIKDLL